MPSLPAINTSIYLWLNWIDRGLRFPCSDHLEPDPLILLVFIIINIIVIMMTQCSFLHTLITTIICSIKSLYSHLYSGYNTTWCHDSYMPITLCKHRLWWPSSSPSLSSWTSSVQEKLAFSCPKQTAWHWQRRSLFWVEIKTLKSLKLIRLQMLSLKVFQHWKLQICLSAISCCSQLFSKNSAESVAKMLGSI